ncbi:MAG: MBL fold metallo-hydrolase [Anaerolineae bacterium]|uniref:MBL fold metallo-hydrolase n=1 Tax=Promineifilum sp. TaxID=2664178 RepID=UPI001D4C4278|nr:MBL fold metallo-hydrolase [Anaerolineales bacterium]MCB8935556.1 MBL fold metallo-hydrolase [Promineifilum sp.]MCO5180647.1 MBL fold metallo-hydrolase [Promineifilum sp.]MCW5847626.1 MBL fold metallo-hydrolase [Anaerolineae bacterium]
MEPIRIELTIGWSMGSVNCYLFTHPEVILIDAGVKSEACWAELVDGLAANGVAVGDISRVVVTHPHVDHFGLAGRIVAESDATVWISELGAPWLTDMPAMWAARMAYYRRDLLPPVGLPPKTNEAILRDMKGLAAAADPVPAERVVTFRADGLLQMGGRGWRVIHTPGHAAAQTVFYQPETRQLLSADMLLAVTPAPVIDHPAPGEKRAPALPLFLRSLAAMETLAVDTVHPGHGRPFGDHHEVISRQRARILGRQAQCLDLIRDGRTTIPELLDQMYAHQPPESRVAGLWMLIGYLDLLLADGAIVEEMLGDVTHYRAV